MHCFVLQQIKTAQFCFIPFPSLYLFFFSCLLSPLFSSFLLSFLTSSLISINYTQLLPFFHPFLPLKVIPFDQRVDVFQSLLQIDKANFFSSDGGRGAMAAVGTCCLIITFRLFGYLYFHSLIFLLSFSFIYSSFSLFLYSLCFFLFPFLLFFFLLSSLFFSTITFSFFAIFIFLSFLSFYFFFFPLFFASFFYSLPFISFTNYPFIHLLSPIFLFSLLHSFQSLLSFFFLFSVRLFFAISFVCFPF
jgi:hypothetical protein